MIDGVTGRWFGTETLFKPSFVTRLAQHQMTFTKFNCVVMLSVWDYGHCQSGRPSQSSALKTWATPTASSSADLAQCTSSLQHWLWHNELLLNPNKSVAALLDTRQRRLADPCRCCWVWHKIVRPSEGSWCHTRLVDDARHSSDSDSQGL